MRFVIRGKSATWLARPGFFSGLFRKLLGARVTGLSPVVVTVSRIRQELHRAAVSAPAEGQPTTALLGRIFHETFAALMGPDSAGNWRRALRPRDLDNPNRLREHVYVSLTGPKLLQSSAALQHSTDQVLAFWRAVCEMCEWTRGMLSTAQARGIIQYDERAGEWHGASDLVAVEHELSLEIHRDRWSRPVL